MGIDLGSMMGLGKFGDSSSNGVNPLNLKKNDVLNLTKHNPGLEKVILGAGWDVANVGQDFDLDISAFLLQENGRVKNVPDDIIFFNNMKAPGIRLEGDNRTGAGEGDDERIRIDLSLLPSSVSKIVFLVTIHEAQSRRQTFGMVENSYIRLLDEKNHEKEICRFNLKENGSTVTSVIFAEISKDNSEWQFKALGEGKIADLNGLLSLYM
ncbi:MAG: TerD family protein [Clostridium sp.]